MENICKFCGNEAVYTYKPDQHFCDTCAPKVLVCTICDELHLTSTMRYIEGAGFICSSCHVDTDVCGGCGKESMIVVRDGSGKGLCRRCFGHTHYICDVTKKVYAKANRLDDLTYERWVDILPSRECSVEGAGFLIAQAMVAGKTPKKIEACAWCGNHVSRFKTANGVHLCTDCQRNAAICTDCGSWENKFDVHTVEGGKICNTCFGEKYFVCRGCHNPHKRTPGYSNEQFCATCAPHYGTCALCDGFFRVEDGSTIATHQGPIRVCMHCAANAARQRCVCCGAGGAYATPNAGAADSGLLLCATCHTTTTLAPVCNYTYKPVPKYFPKGSARTLYIGIENEMSFLDSIPSERNQKKFLWEKSGQLNKAFGDLLYMKRDSSIDFGFEVVTHPMTFKHFQGVDWTPMFQLGSNKSTSCGMHIHMSKDVFGHSQLLKFLLFFNENPAFIEFIAERPANTYTKHMVKETLVSKAKSKTFYERYEQINLQNKHTVEVRVFATAVTKEQFCKNVEFVHALFEYTKQCSIKDVNVSKFLAFVKRYTKTYANLNNFVSNWK